MQFKTNFKSVLDGKEYFVWCELVGFEGEFKEVAFLGEGNYGYTFALSYQPTGLVGLDVSKVAVKLLKPIPASTAKVVSDPRTEFEDEIKSLYSLQHEGIAEILSHGHAKFHLSSMELHAPLPDDDAKETLFLVEKYYGDARTMKDWHTDGFRGPQEMEFGASFALSFLTKALAALAYIQDKEILHLDLHPGNIMVEVADSPDGPIAQRVVIIDFGKAKLPKHELGDSLTALGGGAFDFKHPKLRRHLRRNKAPQDLFLGAIRYTYDLFSLAAMVDWLNDLVGRKFLDETGPSAEFLRILVQSMKNETAITDQTLYTANHALAAIANWSKPTVWTPGRLVRLSSGQNTSISSDYMAVIDTPDFQRLRTVLQLGLTHYVYPSATHTRFSHALGVFHSFGRYIDALRMNSGWFRFRYSSEELRIARLGALIHDLGHYHFAHYLEELSKLQDAPKLHHEHISKRILRGEFQAPNKKPEIVKVIEQRFGKLAVQESQRIFENDQFLRSLIDGPIDCDKADYLVRDGVSSGVPYAQSIDIERLLGALRPVQTAHSGYVLGVDAKGLAPVEALLAARYQLYSEVYWHKTCRAMASMIRHAFYLRVKGQSMGQAQFDLLVLSPSGEQFLHSIGSSLTNEERKELLDGIAIGKTRTIYKRLITSSPVWDDEVENSLFNYFKRSPPRSYGDVQVLKEAIREKINAFGRKKAIAWVDIQEHQLLLDVPLAKDDVRVVQVLYADGIGSGEPRPLGAVSGLVREPSQVFARTQKIRLYASPDVKVRLSQDGLLNEIRPLVSQAVRTIGSN